jgi:ADP-heptose:LPS heptosyltransferase
MPLFDDTPKIVCRHTFKKRSALGHWQDLWKVCSGTSWDWIIDLRGSLFSWTLRSAKRSVWRKPSKVMHRVEAMAACAGIMPVPAPYIPISCSRQDKVHKLTPDKPYFVLAPAANWLGKEWPLERFQALSQKLLEGPCQGWKVGILAAPDEYERLGPLYKTLGDALLPIDSERSLLDSAAFLKDASLFVGNDSGLMHMASALKVPTVGLFGPSPEVLYDPYGPTGLSVRTPLSYQRLMAQRKIEPKACFMESLEIETVYRAVCNHGKQCGVFSCVV